MTKENKRRRYRSFVFGETVGSMVDALPPEHQLRFYKYVKDYGLYEIEPELSGFEESIWIGIRTFIDNTRDTRGAPVGNQNAVKAAGRVQESVHETDAFETQEYEEEDEDEDVLDVEEDAIDTDETDGAETNKTNKSNKTNSKTKETNKTNKTILSMNKNHNKNKNSKNQESMCVNFYESTHTFESLESEAKKPPDEKPPEKIVCMDFSKPFNSQFDPQAGPAETAATPEPLEFDRYAALHPGQAPPDKNAFETIRKTWNTPMNGVQLPECRALLINLNYKQREILSVALAQYKAAEIVEAVKNYFWMQLNPKKVRVCLKFSNLFSFLEKGLPTFCNEIVFDNNYLQAREAK